MTKLVRKGILASVTAALITGVIPSAAAATASPSILDDPTGRCIEGYHLHDHHQMTTPWPTARGFVCTKQKSFVD